MLPLVLRSLRRSHRHHLVSPSTHMFTTTTTAQDKRNRSASQNILGKMKKLIVFGEKEEAKKFAFDFGLNPKDTNHLLSMPKTELTYMRLAYLQSFWRDNNDYKAEKLYEAIENAGELTRKLKKCRAHLPKTDSCSGFESSEANFVLFVDYFI